MAKELLLLIEVPFAFKRRLMVSANHFNQNNILIAFINGVMDTVAEYYRERIIDKEDVFRRLDYNCSEWSSAIIDSISSDDEGNYIEEDYARNYQEMENFYKALNTWEFVGLYDRFFENISQHNIDFDTFSWEVDHIAKGNEIIVGLRVMKGN